MKRYCGRDFSDAEVALIRTFIAEDPQRSRAALSRLACRALHWYQPDGGLKEMSCRVAMLRMQKDGLIQLPPPRCQRPQARFRMGVETEPQTPIDVPVQALPELQLRMVGTGTDSRRWNEYMQRYHYRGYQARPGAQLRYWVSAGDTLMAWLGFGAAAWQCAPRDDFIGWSHAQRQNNRHLVVNNARFLILPWVQSKNLASKILGLIARQLPEDWQNRYGYRPLLLETFVEQGRFKGVCYQAANWVHVGHTKGRGKLGPAGKPSVPIKDLWLYPLEKRFRGLLTR
jgi:hypothetical protein